MKNSNPNISHGKEGAEGDHPKLLESEPQSKGEKDKKSVGKELDNSEISKGLRLSPEITTYMAWKNILPE